jgi:hypothetical protein
MAEGPGADRYRVFGIHEPGRTVDELLGLRLEVDRPAGLVRLHRLADGVEVDALRYEGSSGDYAVTSFSEDGSMFAVIEPYDVTLFAPWASAAGPGTAPDRAAIPVSGSSSLTETALTAVATLTREVLKTMIRTRLKIGGAVLAGGLLAAGAGVVARHQRKNFLFFGSDRGG